MNKARLLLIGIVFVGLASGVLAFKTVRYTGIPAMTRTTVVSTFGTIYSRIGGATFCFSHPSLFVTPIAPGMISTVLTTTGFTTPAIVLRRAGGVETFTIPNWLCTTTLTLVTLAD